MAAMSRDLQPAQQGHLQSASAGARSALYEWGALPCSAVGVEEVEVAHVPPSTSLSEEPRERVDDERRRMLALTGVEAAILWVPGLLSAQELALLSACAASVSVACSTSCALQLRTAASRLLLPCVDAHCMRSERFLHRMQRQVAGLRATCIAAENYSAGINADGQLLIWGRPGWMEVRASQNPEAQQSPHWPALQPQIVAPAVEQKSASPSSFSPSIALHDGNGGGGGQRIITLAASRHAVFALTEEGTLMYAKVQWRSDHTVRVVELYPLSELADVRIASISTRYGQAFAVTTDGEVYAWGKRSGDGDKPEHSCSMGFGHVSTLLRPTRLPCFGRSTHKTPIRSVATGVSHTLFVTFSGEVFSLGRMENGKLGIGLPPSCRKGAKQILTPRKIHFGDREAPHIVFAAAGARHSLFMAASGNVWGCGMNKTGALPTSDPGDACKNIWQPVLMDKIDAFCVSLAAGISCSFFVAEIGCVFFTGTARQTPRPFGRKAAADPRDPRKVPGLQMVEQVTVSMELCDYQWEHAIFVQEGGNLFGWGHLGHGEFQPSSQPLRLRSRREDPVKPQQPLTVGFCGSVVPLA